MVAHRKSEENKASEHVSAKLTPVEKDLLEQLIERRTAAQEEAGEPGNPTFAGWLRWTIRQQAKAAGLRPRKRANSNKQG